MKRLLVLSFTIFCGHASACMLTLGVGSCGNSGPHPITTPSLVPAISTYGNVNVGQTNNGLRPNNGVAGSAFVPTPIGNSHVLFFQGSVAPVLNNVQNLRGAGASNQGLWVSAIGTIGQPAFFMQETLGTGEQWWNGLGLTLASPVQSAGATAYTNGGYNSGTATGGGCQRPPSVVYIGTNNGGNTIGGNMPITDPGELCSATVAPSLSLINVPGSGAQQATDAGGLATTCASNSPVSGSFTVTAHVAVAHGLSMGMTYPMSGMSVAGYNVTYTALPGTTGTTLIGASATSGTCPNSGVTGEGFALAGTGGTVTFPTALATNPWQVGGTGITTKVGGHICGIVAENGANSAFPGSQAMAVDDEHGTPLPGSPALIPWLNLGTANFQGHTLSNTQSPSSPALVIDGPNPWTITAATFSSTTGYATFTTSAAPGYSPGSEFIVSGVTNSGPGSFNLTYVATNPTGLSLAAYQASTTIWANPLSGPVGVPQVSALTNSSTMTGGTLPNMASVPMPNMQILGTNAGTIIDPYGTFGGTGAGGVGTYGLTINQTGAPTVTITVITAPSGGSSTMTVTNAPAPPLAPGQAITLAAYGASPMIIQSYGTASGGAGTYIVSNTNTGSFSGTGAGTSAGTLWSAGTPGVINAAPGFYQSIAGLPGSNAGVATARTQAAIGDFWGILGTSRTTIVTGALGWGGSMANMAMLWGNFPMTSAGAPDPTQLASLCTNQEDVQTFAAAQTVASNPITVRSDYRLSDLGIWGDSSNATITGYITNSGGTSATLNVVSTTFGSLALPTGTQTAIVTGIGLLPTAAPTIGLTTSASSTYAMSPNTTAALGSAGSPITFSIGLSAPAAPLPSNVVTGFVDDGNGAGCPGVSCAPSGVAGNILTVTGVPTANMATFTGQTNTQFTAKIDNGSGGAGNILTVTLPAILNLSTSPVGPQVGIGMTVSDIAGHVAGGTTVLAQTSTTGTSGTSANQFGIAGTYTISGSPQLVASEIMVGSGPLPAAAQFLNVSGVTGTVVANMLVTDGPTGTINSATPITINGTANPWATLPHYYGAIAPETMYGTASYVIPGQYALGTGITAPISVTGIKSLVSRGCATTGFPVCGQYTLSSAANVVGSETITLTGLGDGGTIAAGPALTIKDVGAGISYIVDNGTINCSVLGSCIGTGSVPVSGTFDTSLLGGKPSVLQGQVSFTANGPPIPGCSACAWTNLSSYTATQVGSTTVWNWSGTIANVPAEQGPLFVSVCAANATPACPTNNGTAYVSAPNLVKMGLGLDWNGEGTINPMESVQGGIANNSFTGLWGAVKSSTNTINSGPGPYEQGPAVAGTPWAPALMQMFPGDRFSINGNVPTTEGNGYLQQLLTRAFGWPVTIVQRDRDGIGTQLEQIGDVTQTQTIGLGDGSTTVWCSAGAFCSTVSVAGPLWFNLASMTGATLDKATITGTTLSVPATVVTPVASVAGLSQGALAPGLVLSDKTGQITGSPTLVTCLTGCTAANFNSDLAQTWTISVSQATPVTAERMRADPPGAAAWPFSYLLQSRNTPIVGLNNFGQQMIQAGTFKITVGGTAVCQDGSVSGGVFTPSPFAYNTQLGLCVDTTSGVTIATFNYNTGDYQTNFATAPTSGAVILASWTNIVTPDDGATSTPNERPHGLDYFGTDGVHGFVTAAFNKTPNGVNGHIFGPNQGDAGVVASIGGGTFPSNYVLGAPGYTQSLSGVYGTKMPSIIPGQRADTPFMCGNFWRVEGAAYFNSSNDSGDSINMSYEQWNIDACQPSSWTGSIASSSATTGTLTLSSAAVGPMWEGEVIGCNPATPLTCSIPVGPLGGVYITGLLTGSWGANGSTYGVACVQCVAAFPTGTIAMENAVQYQGPGTPVYLGTLNDIPLQLSIPTVAQNVSFHMTNGFTAAGRVGRRWAAQIWGALTNSSHALFPPNASNPTLDRTPADAGVNACDTSALSTPCLDVGTGGAGGPYAASHSATITGASAVVTGGISANARPFVVGQELFCSGCATGLIVTAVSLPPTQDSRTGQGQVGQTFTITASGSLLTGPTTETVTAGCTSTGAHQANCIDIAFSIHTAGTYGVTASLATCGENNLNGNASPANPPNGTCMSNGVGSFVQGFLIGSKQFPWTLTTGQNYDDGADIDGGGFNRSAGFNCHIVAAEVVQCVHGPAWSSGVPSLGQWTAGSAYVSYGDAAVSTGRVSGMKGYPGGQSFASLPSGFSAGSGYTPGPYTVTAAFKVITTPSYNATTGILTMNFATAPFGATIGSQANGSNVLVAGLTGAGGLLLNGSWPVTGTAVSGTQVTVQGPTGLSTTVTASASSFMSSCGTLNGGNAPVFDFVVGGGGTIIDAYMSSQNTPTLGALGNGNYGAGGTCSVFLTTGSGTGGSVTLPLSPLEGMPGIGSANSDQNMMGILLYDNSGLPTNPLNLFFTNYHGGYFEPGLPVRPFGFVLGAAVSG